MDSAVAQRLLALNHEFYERFGVEFSATRQRLQPGVKRILESLTGGESILDLGCGNGELARALARRGHHGAYLGVDFSPPLLQDAQSLPEGFPAKFLQADLARLPASLRTPGNDSWSVITAFATLHHIPSRETRSRILRTIHTLLHPNGRFFHSNWQFRNSSRLASRVQPWERIGLNASDVEEGDALLDWRRGGEGLRYVHQFSEQELANLASECGFEVIQTFYSDGQGGRLGLYQEWRPIETGA